MVGDVLDRTKLLLLPRFRVDFFLDDPPITIERGLNTGDLRTAAQRETTDEENLPQLVSYIRK
jgi:hypothetical protein